MLVQPVILRANRNDAKLLVDIGKQTFIESHGKSAEEQDINQYVSSKFTIEEMERELEDPNNFFHLIFYNREIVGYSKIILNVPQSNIHLQNVSKLERLYILEKYYDFKLGFELFRFNIELSKKHKQAGVWLFVWKENHRAFKFYIKAGFEIIGSYDFIITESHSNPNHQMFLQY